MFFVVNKICGGNWSRTHANTSWLLIYPARYQYVVCFFTRALILYVAAGALPEALETLRNNQRPDSAALFLLACHEIYSQITRESEPADEVSGSATERSQKLLFPSKNVSDEDLIAVSEVFGQYQQKLIHLCMDMEPTVNWGSTPQILRFCCLHGSGLQL